MVWLLLAIVCYFLLKLKKGLYKSLLYYIIGKTKMKRSAGMIFEKPYQAFLQADGCGCGGGCGGNDSKESDCDCGGDCGCGDDCDCKH